MEEAVPKIKKLEASKDKHNKLWVMRKISKTDKEKKLNKKLN